MNDFNKLVMVVPEKYSIHRWRRYRVVRILCWAR